ncbi:MAG: S-layer homology domain-containing protein [Bryobacteraceae bacterium]
MISSALTAQMQTSGQVAGGQTSVSSSFNPLQPTGFPAPVVQSYPLLPQPTVSAGEYASQKSAAQSRVPFRTPAPPVISYTDGIGATYIPDVRIVPLLTAPSVSFEAPQAESPQDPPNPDMAVGPDDLLLVENSNIALYTKAGSFVSRTQFSQWFSAQLPVVCPGGLATCQFLTPSIRYDQLHGRFLLSLTVLRGTGSARQSSFLLSVSNGATYAGGWKNWALDASLDGSTATQNWADFPQLGFDNQAVYLTANMFSAVTNQVQYAKVRILKMVELYNPGAATLTYQDLFNLQNADLSTVVSLQPPLSRGRPGYIPHEYGVLVNASNTADATVVTLWRIINPVGANPVASRITVPGFWKYSFPAPASQLNSPVTLDTGDSRILKAVFRDGFLFIAQNVSQADEPSTVVYSRIDTTIGTVTFQERWTNGNFFYPALDIPASLNSATIGFPNKLVAGTSTNALGNPAFPGIQEVKTGEGFYDISTSGLARWGQYFGAAIDPQQGGLWVSGQYAKDRPDGASHYGEWVSYFPWSTNTKFGDVPPSSFSFHYVNVAKLWNLTTNCAPSLFCPALPITRADLAIFLIRAIYGDYFYINNIPYFTDVPTNHRAFAYIQKLRELGITAGCTTTTFCPDLSSTREQMAAFIVRGKLKELQGDNFNYPPAAYFTDVPAGNFFFPYIQKLRELGITSGCTATQYCATADVTREQAAVFIVRAFLN